MKKTLLYIAITIVIIIVASYIYSQFTFRNMAPGLKDDIQKTFVFVTGEQNEN